MQRLLSVGVAEFADQGIAQGGGQAQDFFGTFEWGLVAKGQKEDGVGEVLLVRRGY